MYPSFGIEDWSTSHANQTGVFDLMSSTAHFLIFSIGTFRYLVVRPPTTLPSRSTVKTVLYGWRGSFTSVIASDTS